MKPSRIPVTIFLIAVISFVFLAQTQLGGSKDETTLVRMGAIIPDLFERGDYWRLGAAMFLHIGILHLALNLWALYQLGGVFEALFGQIRFASTYIVAGLAASSVSALFARGIAAGASGAIFGILGASIIAIRRSPLWRNQTWTRGFTQQLIGWAVLNIIIGFSPGIDNAAHIGGFVAGLALGFLPHRVPPPPPNQIIIDVDERRG